MTINEIRAKAEQFIADGYECMYDDRDLMNVDIYRDAIIEEFVKCVRAGADCTVMTLDTIANEWVTENLSPIEEEE